MTAASMACARHCRERIFADHCRLRNDRPASVRTVMKSSRTKVACTRTVEVYEGEITSLIMTKNSDFAEALAWRLPRGCFRGAEHLRRNETCEVVPANTWQKIQETYYDQAKNRSTRSCGELWCADQEEDVTWEEKQRGTSEAGSQT